MIWKQSVAAAGGECRHWLPTDSTRQTTTPVRAAWLDSIPLGREASLSHSPGRQADDKSRAGRAVFSVAGASRRCNHADCLSAFPSHIFLALFSFLSSAWWTGPQPRLVSRKQARLKTRWKIPRRKSVTQNFLICSPVKALEAVRCLWMGCLPEGLQRQSHSILSFKSSTCTFFLSVHMQVVKVTKQLYLFALLCLCCTYKPSVSRSVPCKPSSSSSSQRLTAECCFICPISQQHTQSANQTQAGSELFA